MERNIDYKRLVNRHAPSSPMLTNCVKAFIVGGLICFSGELLKSLFALAMPEKKAYLATTLFFIILSSALTALGVFDKIGRHAGAGTLLPVTGFSNSVTSSALDSKSEGFIAGVGSKIFTVAGPVILYSCAAGTVYGIIYYIYLLFV